MARPKAANWVAEATVTSGTGDIILSGSLEGFAPFSVMDDGEVYYTLQDGLDKECGIGTLTSGKIHRTTVLASYINGTYSSPGAKLTLSGYAEVYCTVNADLFNEMNNALAKLDGIEDGATADQVASEVPSNTNFMVLANNVQGAIDSLARNIPIYSGGASFSAAPASIALLSVGEVFQNAQYFINTNTMIMYKAAKPVSGTIAILLTRQQTQY